MWNNSIRKIAHQMVRQCSKEAKSSVPLRREKFVNSVTLVGRTGNHPEVKVKQDQNTFVTFPLATNTYFRSDDGEMQQKTEWHRINIYKPSLRDYVADFIQKGDRLYVQGRIASSIYRPEDGSERKVVRIYADEVIRLSATGNQLNSDDEGELNVKL